ncbi:m150R [Myxoma virus]|uniref:M150R n=1 Tax=Myxoma virus TaxID=10273 RepID=E2CZN8_9POXV|nr:m150R [Myxoma virus]AGU99831.1 m150R [Myxoma virus]
MAFDPLHEYCLEEEPIHVDTLKAYLARYNPNAVYYRISTFRRYLQRKDVRQDIVELFIQHGAAVNGTPEDNGTPLYTLFDNRRAVYKNIVDVARCLLSNGADINCKGRGEHPFCCLLKNPKINHKDFIQYLIKKYPVDIYVLDGLTLNAIQCYVRSGNVNFDVLHFFIDNDVPYNRVGPLNTDILIWYIQYNVHRLDAKIIQLLISKGVTITQHKYREHYLYHAAKACIKQQHRVEFDKATFDFILSHMDANYINIVHKQTLLQCAIQRGYVQAFDYLLSKGADIHVCDRLAENCLQMAMLKGNKYILNKVLYRTRLDEYEKAFERIDLDIMYDGKCVYSNKVVRAMLAYFIKSRPGYDFRFAYGYLYTCYGRTIETCFKHVEEMKTQKINGLSVYDILFNNAIQTYQCGTIHELTRCKPRYTYYDRYIDRVIKKISIRYEDVLRAIDRVDDVCEGNDNRWNIIPPEIKFKIINNLTNKDLVFLKMKIKRI